MRQRLDEHAVEVLGAGMATAAAFVVTDAEQTLIGGGYGAPDDALWPIASVGKAFAAVIALQLAEEGALDLHAPVQDSLPWFSVRSRHAPITLHHLLTHTSGVIENSDRAPASGYDVVALADTEAGFAPGEHRHYANIGYRAVGLALEAGTRQPYGDLIKRRIFDRLGLSDWLRSPVRSGARTGPCCPPRASTL